MAKPIWLVVPVAAVGVAAAVWYFGSDREAAATMDPRDGRAVALGKQVYARECASCHGVNLEGQPDWRVRLANGRMPAPPHDVSGHTWHHSDRVLFDITKRGPAAYPAGYVTDMPAYAERLSDREIAAVIAYIKSTWPADILSRQQRATH
ncbi:MAG: cytochrome c [Enhydrobacter sp.]|nr:MAG: cytochrome c [Enhydrobacter sp.]